MGFLDNLIKFSGARRDTPAQHPFFSEVLDELGRDISTAAFYEQHLTSAIDVADRYFAQQLAAIPGGITLSAQALIHDPVLSVLFHTAEDICFALGRSIETREVVPGFSRAGQVDVYALLGMRCREADQTPGHPPVFMDHSLKCIAPSEAEVREYIASAARTRLLKAFAEHVDKIRRKGKLLRIEWNILNPLARGNNASDSHEYVYAEDELKPDNLLRGLCAWLSDPAAYLRITSGGARISIQKPGVEPTLVELPILHSTDRRQWIVCLVKFPVQECVDALARESRTHRYIYI